MKQSGFNPKARWDRHLPAGRHGPQDTRYQTPELNEKIQVIASFSGGKIYPRMFTWNNKPYKITEITYNWQEHKGSETINYFSVSTGTDLYQISFNSSSLGWRIDKIIE